MSRRLVMFHIDPDTAGGMRLARGVDWDSVVSLAIHGKLKLLRQTGTHRTLAAAPDRPTAAVARREKPRKLRHLRERDPSPDEILRRAAEVRAARH